MLMRDALIVRRASESPSCDEHHTVVSKKDKEIRVHLWKNTYLHNIEKLLV